MLVRIYILVCMNIVVFFLSDFVHKFVRLPGYAKMLLTASARVRRSECIIWTDAFGRTMGFFPAQLVI